MTAPKILLGDKLVAPTPKRAGQAAPPGWTGEVIAFEPYLFGVVLARLRGVDPLDLREFQVGIGDLETHWRRAPRDPVAELAQRHGFAYYPDLETAVKDSE